MKHIFTKISIIIGIGLFICACNATKNVADRQRLLVKNSILVDGKPNKDAVIDNLLLQKPNNQIFGFKLRLNLFNLAKQNPDSIFRDNFLKNPDKLRRQTWLLSEKQVKRKGESFMFSGFHKFLKKTGEPPVIVDKAKTEKSVKRIKAYFFNKGFFNAAIRTSLDTATSKKAIVNYNISKGIVSVLDSIRTQIETPALDSLFRLNQKLSFLKTGKAYTSSDFDGEQDRITTHFRNSGAFDFQPSNVVFDLDTIGTKNKINVLLKIKNQQLRNGDSTTTRPFKLYKISRVDIFADLPTAQNKTITDSVVYKNFHLYSHKKLKYRPKAITDAIFIEQNLLYSDIKDNLTRRYLNNLKIFNFSSITYLPDPKNPDALVTKIVLSPKRKYSFGWSTDVLDQANRLWTKN